MTAIATQRRDAVPASRGSARVVPRRSRSEHAVGRSVIGLTAKSEIAPWLTPHFSSAAL